MIRLAHLESRTSGPDPPDAGPLADVPVFGALGSPGTGRLVAASWRDGELHGELDIPPGWAEAADAGGLEAHCVWSPAGALERIVLARATPITPTESPDTPPRRDRDGAGGRGPIPEPGGTTAMAATQTQHDERDDDPTAAARGDRDGAPAGDAGRGRDPDDPGDDPAALKAELERLRKAHADANRKAETERKQYRAARERLDEIDRAAEERRKEELPEVERVRADLKARDAEIRARDDRLRAQEREIEDLRVDILVIQEATGKFRNPKAALRLIDRDRIEVDPDTREVRLATVKDAIKRVLDEFPELNGAGSGSGSPAARFGARPAAGAGRPAPELDPRSRLARTGGYEAM
jgi:hypothetical protein